MNELLTGIKLQDIHPCPSLSLYLHIPFCIKKCSYCDFFSRPLEDGRGFAKKLIDELQYFLDRLSPETVPTIFIGGGNPPLIGLDALHELCSGINAMVPNRPREWTIESNPAQISPDFLQMIRETGVTRLSIGIQTLHDELLTSIGRAGSRNNALYALNTISSYWTGKLNIDLLSGIPGQKRTMAETDILEVLAFKPDHVSLYELTVEENTELYKSIAAGKLTPMEHRLSAAVYSRQQALLETNGYSRYEISNYAISGQESKHNLGYWKLTPYLGIGPSAASTLPGAHGPVRLSARASLPEWNYQAEQIAPDDFLFEHIMMGMRLSEGIDRYRICRIFGYLPEEYYPETVKKWKQQKLLSLSKSNLALINGGTDFLNTFLSDILEEEPKKPIFPKPCWPE